MDKDPYKYFRIEARELLDGLNQAVLQLERSGNDQDVVRRILRLAHTLKGASRVVKQPAIADLAHSVEETFALYRDSNASIPQATTNCALELLDAVAEKITGLDVLETRPKQEKPKLSRNETFETMRVDVEDLDALFGSLSEASIQLAGLRGDLQQLDAAKSQAGSLYEQLRLQSAAGSNGSRLNSASRLRGTADDLRAQLERGVRNLASGLDQLQAEFEQVRDVGSRLRLLPAASIFAGLDRAVRDAAESLHKQVGFETAGGANRLDAHVLLALRDALLHVVRNAVAHGIESIEERKAARKRAQGRVALRVEQKGTRVIFSCSDDGRGIDVEKVRQAAIQRGMLSPSEKAGFDLDAAVRIILAGGVSTTRSIDEVSGRGIGLDVVRETVAQLNGHIRIQSEAGKGTTVEINVPVSMSSLTVLEVDAGGMTAAVPLEAVRETMRVADADLSRSSENTAVVYEGKTIPFLRLPETLRRRPSIERRRAWSVLIVESSKSIAAVGVDRLLGTGTVVIKPLPSTAAVEAMVAGAYLNLEGDPQLLLDPEILVATAHTPRLLVQDSSRKKSPTVLIIDDSLTTRMLEQSILESAGYEVDTATSAEEGLEKAQTKQYGLFLVDVEMPGMDGFEFVARTRADARMNAVPSILVTSRSAPEDRRRGEEVGARAYIVKGEFDQGYLLRMTRELAG